MRIAIVSDMHGNMTALEAVIEDLRQTAPDLILHGGDIADGGANPAQVVDRVRDLGWQRVLGNTDETLFRPAALPEFASQSSKNLQPLFSAIEENAAATRQALGEDRLTWLAALPRQLTHESIAIVHASPESLWRAPAHDASDAELESVYHPLDKPIAIYAHIHVPYMRSLSGMIVVNTGSVSLSFDGDPRASYLLLDDFVPAIRRVEYDLDKELRALSESNLPHSDWIARTLKAARPQMP